MHTDALANVYAKSLFELSNQAGGQAKIVEVAAELEQICELARSDKAFREFLDSPIIDIERRGQALRRIFANRITDLTLRFLLVLNDKKRLVNLESINESFDQLVQEAYGKVEVDLFTAAPLGAPATESIRKRVQSALGKEPVMHPYTDPHMIGGIKLRIGDQLIDGSVATRLRRMKQNLLTGASSDIRDRLTKYIQEGRP